MSMWGRAGALLYSMSVGCRLQGAEAPHADWSFFLDLTKPIPNYYLGGQSESVSTYVPAEVIPMRQTQSVARYLTYTRCSDISVEPVLDPQNTETF